MNSDIYTLAMDIAELILSYGCEADDYEQQVLDFERSISAGEISGIEEMLEEIEQDESFADDESAKRLIEELQQYKVAIPSIARAITLQQFINQFIAPCGAVYC